VPSLLPAGLSVGFGDESGDGALSHKIDVRRVIRRVFAIYAQRATVVITFTAVIFLITGVLDTLLRRSLNRPASLLTLPISIVSEAVVSGLLVAVVADIQNGRGDADVRRLWVSVKPAVGKLMLVDFVAGFGEVIALFLLVVPGLILFTIWSVFAPVVVLERPPGLKALGRSRDLVRGNGWRVFLVILVLVLVWPVLGIGIALADRSWGALAHLVVLVVLPTLAAPISVLASAVLYFDLSDVGRSPTLG
jgi:hypothetical protein